VQRVSRGAVASRCADHPRKGPPDAVSSSRRTSGYPGRSRRDSRGTDEWRSALSRWAASLRTGSCAHIRHQRRRRDQRLLVRQRQSLTCPQCPMVTGSPAKPTTALTTMSALARQLLESRRRQRCDVVAQKVGQRRAVRLALHRRFASHSNSRAIAASSLTRARPPAIDTSSNRPAGVRCAARRVSERQSSLWRPSNATL
jgi:hypothetical protein